MMNHDLRSAEPTIGPAQPAIGLADRLWAKTETLHRDAERSGIVQDLLRGRATLEAYASLLRNLLPVYEALERSLEGSSASTALAPLVRPQIYRAAALRADLAHLDGGRLSVLPVARRYAARIDQVAADRDGAGLVAHAYVRYLGDLNGGQILRRLLEKHLGLGPEGLAFHDFPDVTDLAVLARDYRAAIDAAGLAVGDADQVIDEACLAFRLNIELSIAVRDDFIRSSLGASPDTAEAR